MSRSGLCSGEPYPWAFVGFGEGGVDVRTAGGDQCVAVGVEGLAAECLVGQWSDVDFDCLERPGGADWSFLFARVDAAEGGLGAGLGRLALENDGDSFAVGAGVEGRCGKGAGG